MIALVAMAMAQPSPDYRSHLDQADLFLRREWYDDALAELEAAVAHPDGQHDPEAWALLATTRLQVADVGGARVAAERAQTNARSAEQATRAEELVTWLASSFGVIEVRAPGDGVAMRLDMSLQSLVLDARAQTIAAAVRQQAAAKQTLPRQFTVPAGTWAVGQQTVEVVPNETVSVLIVVRSGIASAIDRAEIEIGAGMAGWQGAHTGHLLPGPTARIAIGWVAGPVEIAGTASWTPQPYRRRDDALQTGFAAGSVGVRLGVPLPDLAPWLVRPAVHVALAWVPGQELACARDGDAFTCTRDGPADLLLYAPGRAVAPSVSLAVARIERTRQFSAGVGIEGAVGTALGTLPASGAAEDLSDGSTLRYTVAPDARTWSATGWSATLAVFLSL